MKKWLPFALTGILALWILSSLFPPQEKEGALAVQEFGRLPILANGRVQPLDSLARNSLLQLREKQTAVTAPWESQSPFLAIIQWFTGLFSSQPPPVRTEPATLTAIQWLMEVSMNPPLADTRPVFRIDNPEVKGLLGLPMEANPEQQSDGKHYSWARLHGKLEELQKESSRVGVIESSKRTPYEQAVLRTFNAAVTYMRLENLIEPQNAHNWERELQEFQRDLPAGVAAVRAQEEGKTFDKAALERTVSDLQRFDTMTQMEPPLVVPPANPAASRMAWQRMGEALMGAARTQANGGEAPSPAIGLYARMAGAYREGRVADFNAAVAEYRTFLGSSFTPELQKASSEQFFNALQPFYKAMVLYVIAGLCALGFWFDPRGWEWLRRTAVWIVVLALVVHTTGLLFRMTLEGRPPVTNLYSSAIFIGWGACILGLVLERFWRNSIGLVVSSGVGFITLIIAHHLSLGGDTMEMMRAVLDTNLWLATHVVVVTLGYASTFVAGALAIIYILRGAFTSSLTPELGQALAKMVYGIVCFATLFSFVGTVLGGIWADQSWGRFWGWDPKENGALIIVLWNALILHARWGGLVRERGLINLAIGGNIVTAWSWFGVNMLGIGLHSYGFTDAAFRWLVGFAVSQVVLILIGVLPIRSWRSFQLPAGREPKPALA